MIENTNEIVHTGVILYVNKKKKSNNTTCNKMYEK